MDIKIPVRHETGTYSVNEISGGTGEFVMNVNDSGMLTYTAGDTAVTVYGVNDPAALTVRYSEEWLLERVTLGDRLIYIAFADDSAAWSAVRDFADESGKSIAAKVAQTGGRAGRVFVEYMKSADEFSFGAIVASEDEVKALPADRADSSGEYDHGKKIDADNSSFAVMFQCLPPNMRTGLIGMSVEIMTEAVRSACDELDTTDDFEFITADLSGSE